MNEIVSVLNMLFTGGMFLVAVLALIVSLNK